MTREPRPRQHRDGASAVEFALVAAPFFFMIFAILELGLVFMKDSVLQNAMMETGRLIRTGQADMNTIDAEEFAQEMCDRMSIFSSDCADAAHIDVETIAQFIDPTLDDPLEDPTAFDESALDYNIGGPGDLVLVRVWYEHSLITPFMSKAMTGVEDGPLMMTATTTFRNEPYR